FGTGGGKRLAEETGLPFLGSIPLAPAFVVQGDLGKPMMTTTFEDVKRPLMAIVQAIINPTNRHKNKA
ncbi:MAG TPA: P-loop NTPase, partial [bacterium]|nr:P-loop NTPase [bacterium]